MPNTNLENSKINMKTRIRNRVQAGQTPRDLGRLAKSARFVGLLDDAEVETDIDTQMSAAIPTASVDDLVEMSEGIKELRGSSADMGQVATTDNLTEGGNKFLKAANVQSEISVAGDLSYDNGVVSYTAPTAAALQVVATVGDLPLDATAGTQAVVTANNKLYVRTADGWYAVALINTAPTISGNDASYTLAEDGTPTVITMIATDPENDPVTFSHSVTSGDLNGTTVVQNDNVFTITPHASNPATFELTFSANDTVNVATSSASSFSLTFGVDWSGISSHSTMLTNANTSTNGFAYNSKYIFSGDAWQGAGQTQIWDRQNGNYNYLESLGVDGLTGSGMGVGLAASDDWLVMVNNEFQNALILIFAMSDIDDFVNGTVNNSNIPFRTWNYNDHSLFPNASNRSTSGGFGYQMAISGNTLVIGDAYAKGLRWDGTYQQNVGRVFVMNLDPAVTGGSRCIKEIVNPDSTDTLTNADPNLTGSNNADPTDLFGNGVAIDNGILAINAPNTDNHAPTGSGEGRVYFYDLTTLENTGTLNLIKYITMDGGKGFGNGYEGPFGFAGGIVFGGNRSSGGVYGDTRNGFVAAYDYNTGLKLWHKTPSDFGATENSTAFGRVATISPDGGAVAFSAIDWGNNDEGKVWVLNSSDGSVIVEDGPKNGDVAYGINLILTDTPEFFARERNETRVFK